MFKVKVFGAGSIGNHLAHASRSLGWNVDIVDIDPSALERTRCQIYPSRYGVWDESINLFTVDEAPRNQYDLIIIGTPPDTHIPIALNALEERPKALLIEKPLCTPDLTNADDLLRKSIEYGVKVFTGYDHAVGSAASIFSSLLQSSQLGKLLTLDVEFREYWGGIFAAHPWLSGPQDTYLGYYSRGGGACGEHSHAINLWQSFSHAAGAGRVTRVNSTMKIVSNPPTDYDELCFLSLVTENGLHGRVVQDVVTNPTIKYARAQCSLGKIEWNCGYPTGADSVQSQNESGHLCEHVFKKTRPDDFKQELSHLHACLVESHIDSPIALEKGLETMLVIAAAYKSHFEKREVCIDYSKGYSLQALS